MGRSPRSLLAVRNAASACVSWMYQRHNWAGSVSSQLVRSKYAPLRRCASCPASTALALRREAASSNRPNRPAVRRAPPHPACRARPRSAGAVPVPCAPSRTDASSCNRCRAISCISAAGTCLQYRWNRLGQQEGVRHYIHFAHPSPSYAQRRHRSLSYETIFAHRSN